METKGTQMTLTQVPNHWLYPRSPLVPMVHNLHAQKSLQKYDTFQA